ncbi:MAG TPA: 2-phosphosulfolactate phosphatase [Bacteroidales bacterium]|nr:2-phosphosulfolactate phosphatase [Bacteroidales bacterium]
MKTVEVCFTPALLDKYTIENKMVVVVDILRATTIITTMFKNGLYKLIPVNNLNEAKSYKEKGFLVAAERDGKKIDFADFNNSPYIFNPEKIKGETLVYSSTNGTNTINSASKAKKVIIASFLNLSAVAEYIKNENQDVLLLCSGWHGSFCTEDALFAGALSKELLTTKQFTTNCDSVMASMDLWSLAKKDILAYIKTIYQYQRLTRLGLGSIINYCFQVDTTRVIVLLKDNYLIEQKDFSN